MNKKSLVISLAILLLAFGIRFYQLDKIPPSLNWDEVSMGYNAYSILKTGQDEWGQYLPLANFRAYGDYPLPLYMYLSMPVIALGGLNEISIRFISAFLGSLTVIVIYFLSRQIFQNSSLGLIAAFLLALSPWSILTSRQVIQSTPAVFLFTLGIWLMFLGIKRKGIWLNLGVISLGLSAYTYHNTRILAPLFFILFLYLFRKPLFNEKYNLLKSIVIAAIFFVPLVWIVFSTTGRARSIWVGIIDQGAINNINEARAISALPGPLPKIVHNKVIYSIQRFTENYIGYFNPYYLGIEGGTQYQFSVPHFGIVHPIELPFFYLGIVLLLVRFTKLPADKKFLVGWLLLSPLPAAITRDPYQVVRSSVMLPVFYLITVYGLGQFIGLIKSIKLKTIFIICFILLIMLSTGKYLSELWSKYPKEYSFAWQYGYQQVTGFVSKEADKYDQIVITKKYGEPHEFLLFYTKYDPYSYQHDPNLIRYEKSNWFWVDGFSKYSFVNDWEIKDRRYSPNTLLITSPKNYPSNSEVIKTINFLDGTAAFDVVVVKG